MNAHEMRVVIAFPFVVRRIKPQRERAARVVHPTADSLVRAKVNEFVLNRRLAEFADRNPVVIDA
jgi:hypothetical protein